MSSGCDVNTVFFFSSYDFLLARKSWSFYCYYVFIIKWDEKDLIFDLSFFVVIINMFFLMGFLEVRLMIGLFVLHILTNLSDSLVVLVYMGFVIVITMALIVTLILILLDFLV